MQYGWAWGPTFLLGGGFAPPVTPAGLFFFSLVPRLRRTPRSPVRAGMQCRPTIIVPETRPREPPRDPRLPPRPERPSGDGPRAAHGVLRARGDLRGPALERRRPQFRAARMVRAHGGGIGAGDAGHRARGGGPSSGRVAPRLRGPLRDPALPRHRPRPRRDREGAARGGRGRGGQPARRLARRTGGNRRRERRRATGRRARVARSASRHVRAALLVPRPSRAARPRALSAGATRRAK